MKPTKENPTSARNPFEEREVFTGAYIPEHLVQYLRLVGLQDGQSVQKVLQRLVEQEFDNIPPSVVIEDIIGQAAEGWVRRITDGSIPNPETEKARKEYLGEIKNRLQRKKIAKSHAEQLVEGIRTRIHKG